ncbi:MAG TPA: adenine phosphoribosyltransferase, partial [Chthoniobacterales bacterium]
MAEERLSKLRAAVRDVPDFPKPGIIFKDITPILKDGALFRTSIDVFLEQCRVKNVDKIVGIDARGFLFGSAVAYELGIGFVPLRKKGRLPYQTESARYSLEYGEAEMELHIDAIERGEKIVLIDDLLATGGTSASAA